MIIRTYRLIQNGKHQLYRPQDEISLCDRHQSRFVVPSGCTLRLVQDHVERDCRTCSMEPKRKRGKQ